MKLIPVKKPTGAPYTPKREFSRLKVKETGSWQQWQWPKQIPFLDMFLDSCSTTLESKFSPRGEHQEARKVPRRTGQKIHGGQCACG